MNRNKRLIYILIIISSVITIISSLLIITNHNRAKERNDEADYSISPQIGGIFNDISEDTEYDEFTGSWFGEGNGNIIFGISTGILKPNTEVLVSLMATSVDEVNLDRDVRFQLTKRDKDNKRIDIIEKEKIHIDTISSATYKEYFSTFLPDKENSHYLLSAEILGEGGQVEDTIVTSIYVPYQVRKGELYLDKDQYTTNETLVLKLENNGPTKVLFGLPYEIEIYKQNEWKQISLNAGFDSIGLSMEPGQTFEQKIPLHQLKESGRYRILKEINEEGTDINSTLFVEFRMDED